MGRLLLMVSLLISNSISARSGGRGPLPEYAGSGSGEFTLGNAIILLVCFVVIILVCTDALSTKPKPYKATKADADRINMNHEINKLLSRGFGDSSIVASLGCTYDKVAFVKKNIQPLKRIDDGTL